MEPAGAFERPEAQRRAEAVAWIGLAIQAGAAAAAAALAAWTRARAAGATAALAAAGVLPWILAIVVSRARRRAAEERVETEDLRRRSPESGIFEGSAPDLWTAAARLHRVEGGFVPAATAAAAAIEAGLGLAILFAADRLFPGRVENGPPGASILAASAFVLFLAGRYAAGMSTHAGWRLLRIPAGHALATALSAFAASLATALAHFGARIPDRVLAIAIACALLLLAVEKAVAAILNVYRPRAPGIAIRWPIDSRLLGLLAEPAGILRTIAQTLDEQLGFRISETWVYRFLERAILPVIVFELAVLWLSTGIVWIEPGERGFVEHLSRRATRILEPGTHLKWPWPIDRAHVFPADEIRSIAVGAEGDAHGAGHGHDGAGPILWTRPHGGPAHLFLVASRAEGESGPAVSLIALSLRIHYRVRDLLDHAYGVRDPEALLRSIARRELVCAAAGVDLSTFLSAGRVEAAPGIRKRIQAAADRARLGVEIVHLAIPNAHPPDAVAPAFEEAVAAFEEKEARVFEAEAYGSRTLEAARRDAYAKGRSAESYRETRVLRIRAEAGRFASRLAAWRACPAYARLRIVLDALEGATAGARKIILAGEAARAAVIDAQEHDVSPFGAGLGAPAATPGQASDGGPK
ncbi:MAG: protease modulator HflK [Planctomycetes bacterium]|nr:protease modulator HflK [Planctomycetota bacterium]